METAEKNATTIRITHSAAYQIQCGNDSFGMWTYGFAFPILMVKNIDYLIFEIFKKMNLMSVNASPENTGVSPFQIDW